MEFFQRDEQGRIIEPVADGDFARGLEKRRKLNKTGENCYLDSEGHVTRDEDKIIACQRSWKERAYAPPGTPFAPRGYMYRKTMSESPLVCRRPEAGTEGSLPIRPTKSN